MLEKNLRILQLNMMKSGPRIEARINDPQSLELDVLLIHEPSITTYRTHINHSVWRLYRPTSQTDAVRFRSLLYVNRRISTSSHRQLPCDHPDVAAINIWTADSQTLVFSVHIPPLPIFTGDVTVPKKRPTYFWEVCWRGTLHYACYTSCARYLTFLGAVSLHL